MENENLTENENINNNQSGAGDAPQLDMSNPISGGIVSQMAIQENLAQSQDTEAERSLDAELSAASALAGGNNSETTSGAEQEK